MGIILALVFGAVLFYIYSRLLQVEKRMSLTENILLDLKMTTENTLLAMGPSSFKGYGEQEDQNDHIEPISGPEPVPAQEVEELGEEDFYKSVLATTLDTHLPEETADVPSAEEDASLSMKEIVLNETTSNDRPKSPSVQVTKMEPNYESMSLKELKQLAKQKGVSVTSNAQKKEVISALKKSVPEAGSQSSSAFPLQGAELTE